MKSIKLTPIKLSLAIIAAGVLIISLVVPYYALNLGIQPCQGLLTDAANCGDADLGGVVFVFGGAPLVAYGLVTLILAVALRLIRPNFDQKRFVACTLIILALLVGLVLFNFIV